MNWFSSLYNGRLERKSLWKFLASYAPHGYFSGYPGQDESGPLHESLWNILEGYALKDIPSRSQVLYTVVAITIYVNGLQIIHSTRS